MKKFTLLLLLILIPLVSASGEQEESPSASGKLSLSLSYFGELLVHPGIQVGADYRVYENKRYNLFLGLSAGGYLHRRNHRALFSQVMLGQQIATKSGLVFRLETGAGGMAVRPHGEIFEYSSEGTPEISTSPWSTKLMFSLTGSLGFRTKIFNLSSEPFLTLGTFWEYPYNSYPLLHPVSRAGVRVRL